MVAGVYKRRNTHLNSSLGIASRYTHVTERKYSSPSKSHQPRPTMPRNSQPACLNWGGGKSSPVAGRKGSQSRIPKSNRKVQV